MKTQRMASRIPSLTYLTISVHALRPLCFPEAQFLLKFNLSFMYEVCPESIGPTFISPRWRYSSSSGGWHP